MKEFHFDVGTLHHQLFIIDYNIK